MKEGNNFKVRDKREKGWFYLDNEYLNGFGKKFGAIGVAVYVALCRHADNKTQKCYPSLKTLAEELDLSKKTIKKYLKQLREYNIIAVKRQRRKDGTLGTNAYYLLDKSEWQEEPQGNKLPMDDHREIDSEPQGSSFHHHREADTPHKETNKKETNNKDTNKNMDSDESTLTGKEINELIGLFEGVNPTYEKLFDMTTQRKAMKELVNKFGLDLIKNLISHLSSISKEKYAPTITTPYQLQQKMGKLKAFYEKRKNNSDVVSI